MLWRIPKFKVEAPKTEGVDEFEKVATSCTPTITVGGATSYSSPYGFYFDGGDLVMLHELKKLADALGLKTAEDVRKVFGEIYEQQYTGFKVMIK